MIGSANRFAHAASLAVAELPGQVYNPLFVCGPPGVGKTHLLQAIGNYVSLCVSGLTVRYANAETFTSQFLAALQHNQIPSFKQRYRSVDVLLLDDVQFLESKERTAEEFLYTIEAALNAGAQVVLSADRPPSAMPLLHAPLKGRFEGGLLVELAAPDQAARLAILRRQAGPDADDAHRQRRARAACATGRRQRAGPSRARWSAPGRTPRSPSSPSRSSWPSTCWARSHPKRPTRPACSPLHRAHPGPHLAGPRGRARDPRLGQAQPSGCLCSPGRHVPLP